MCISSTIRRSLLLGVWLTALLGHGASTVHGQDWTATFELVRPALRRFATSEGIVCASVRVRSSGSQAYFLVPAHCVSEYGSTGFLIGDSVARPVKRSRGLVLFLAEGPDAAGSIVSLRVGAPVGLAVMALGYPYNTPLKLSAGWISGVDYLPGTMIPILYLNLGLLPGFSGGAVVDLRGQLVGLGEAIWAGPITLAIPASTIREFLQGPPEPILKTD